MKNRIYLIFLPLIACFAIALTGCAEKTGLPSTVPCSIQILSDGKPLEGINIALFDKEREVSYSMSAITDAEGIGVISTQLGGNGKDGAPKGSYTMTVSKNWQYNDVANEEEMTYLTDHSEFSVELDKRIAALEEVVPAALGRRAESPLTLDVPTSTTPFVVDVSKQ